MLITATVASGFAGDIKIHFRYGALDSHNFKRQFTDVIFFTHRQWDLNVPE
jgi:hypothetical protein